MWSLLESQTPSVVTNRIDVGGLETGIPALFGALGASWTQNQYRINGFNITDPYIPGRPLADPDPDALSEMKVTEAAKAAPYGGSGVALDLRPKPPTDAFHGDAKVFYSGNALQSDNMDARLREFNFPGPERLSHLDEGSFEAGGKMPAAFARWPAFVSVSTQRLAKSLGGFAAPIDVNVYRGLAEVEPISRGSERLSLLYSGQHVFNSRQGALPEVAPSATTRENDNFGQVQARWSKTLRPNTTIDAGLAAVHAIVDSGIQPGLQTPSTLDLPLMTRTGAAPLSFGGERTRWEANLLYQTAAHRPAGNHDLEAGVDWDRSEIANHWGSLGNLDQVTIEGAAAEVIRWNTPAETREGIQNWNFFAQDVWRPVTWLRMRSGLRVENSSGQAHKAGNQIHWTTVEPRTAFAVPLPRTGAELFGSWSRYGHFLQGRYLDFGNPAALGGQIFGWRDLNGDGLAQPGEIGPRLRVFGGPYSTVDRGLARPFTDEIALGLEKQFPAKILLSARLFRRDDHRLIGITNLGVTNVDYAPVNVLDPGNDGIPGTADDAALTLYNENPAALGRDFFLLTNPPGDHASAKGLEIRLERPLAGAWETAASFTALQTLAPTSPGNSVFENDTGFVGSLYSDPNTLLYDTSRTYFDRAFVGKATGYYRAPRGFRLGVVAKYYDGLPFGRLLFVNGFNQGPFFVRATPRGHPGGFQTQFNGTLDLRLARRFAFRGGAFTGDIDCFNCLNMNRNTLESDLTGPSFASRIPLAIEPPRVVRLGVEWEF